MERYALKQAGEMEISNRHEVVVNAAHTPVGFFAGNRPQCCVGIVISPPHYRSQSKDTDVCRKPPVKPDRQGTDFTEQILEDSLGPESHGLAPGQVNHNGRWQHEITR